MKISNYAFRYCTNLKAIEISSVDTQLGMNVFHRCYNLLNCTLKNVSKIGSICFEHCHRLNDISIYFDNVLNIEDEAFANCYNLKNIHFISKSKESKIILGKRAFENCKSLKIVEISCSELQVEDDAFVGCSSLETVKFLT